MSHLRTALAFVLISLPLHGRAQTPSKPFDLTVDNIMRANDLTGYSPRDAYWSPDSKQVYFEWKKASDPRQKPYDHYVVGADGAGMRLLTDAEVKLLPPNGGIDSPDKSQILYSQSGDLFLWDRATGVRHQLTSTDDFEGNPGFSIDGKSIFFTRGDNAYALSLADSSLRQLTSIRGGSPPPPDSPAAAATAKMKESTSQDELKKTQAELFETIRDAAKRREEYEAKQKLEVRRKPFYVPDGQFVEGIDISPDGVWAAVTVGEGRANRGPRSVVPRFITESGYTEASPGRSLVGEPQGRSRVSLISVATGEAVPFDFVPTETHAVGVKAGPRVVTWQSWQWSDDGKHAVVTARTLDHKDVWIFGVDPTTGKKTLLVQKHDDAWIGGPDNGAIGFLPDNRRVWFVSEHDGFAQLYEAPVDGSAPPTQLTKGPFEVHNVTLSQDKTHFYFAADMQSPATWDLYSLAIDGGAPARIDRVSGGDDEGFTVSPDDKSIALIRSTSNRPPELFLAPNRPSPPTTGSNLTAANVTVAEVQVTHSPTAEWLSYDWIDPPIVNYPARDGKLVAARMYKPRKWKRGGPLVVFVHGAGYLQNVDSWWSHYFREYMFHNLLAEHGYLVLDIDYRGSAGYGRDWRTAIYRHMGGQDLDDVVDGVRWGVANQGVDPKRVGIYGGSYGGFLTLMAMFTASDTFAAGAALRPVTDWQHYNHEYTSEILNEPQNDPEAYRKSSPILFANGLKGALLICHGMVDQNVHFQDSVRLTQRLIELHKENWQLAPYPVEDHGFTEPSSWDDEYKRILKLFDENLKSH